VQKVIEKTSKILNEKMMKYVENYKSAESSTLGKEEKCPFTSIGDIIKTAIANGTNTHCEALFGEVIPYFDFEIENTTEGDEVKVLRDILNAIEKHYPDGVIYTFNGSRMYTNTKGVEGWKVSFHVIIRGAGYYESGKHFFHSIPDEVKKVAGFDDGVYKEAGSRQLFKLPYCHKPYENDATDMVRCELIRDEDDEVDDYIDDYVAIRDADEKYSNWCISNIEGEKLVKIELPEKKFQPVIHTGSNAESKESKFPPPTVEELDKLIDMLKPERARMHNDRLPFIWCLANIQEEFGFDTMDLAAKFMQKCPEEFTFSKLLRDFQSKANGNGYGIAYLKQEAKKDDPDAYSQLYQSLRAEAKVTYYEPEDLNKILTNRDATVADVEDYMRGCIMRIDDGKSGFYMTRRKDGWVNAGRQLFIGDTNYDVHYVDEKGKKKTIGWCPILKALRQKELFTSNVFRGITFKPSFTCIPETPGLLNTFLGFPVQVPAEIDEKDEDIQTILYHIREVFCDNFEPMCEYFLNFLSHMVQSPHEKLGVAIVIQSDQGVGKNLFWETLAKKMLGDQYYLTISDLATLTNNFNALQANKMLVHLDEMNIFGGSISTANQLKSIITRTKITITEKGKDSYEIPDSAHHVISSNCDIPVRIENSDRRFAVTRASSKHRGDKKYFTKLKAALERGTDKFVRYLMDRDISEWNASADIPETKARSEMKEDVMSPSHRYMRELAGLRVPFSAYGRTQLWETKIDESKDEDASDEELDEIKFNEVRMKATDLYSEYVTYSREANQVVSSSTVFSREMKKLGFEAKSMKLKGTKTTIWGYQLTIDAIRDGLRKFLNEPDMQF